MPKTLDQFLAESGRQSTLDELGRNLQLDKARSEFAAGRGQFAISPTVGAGVGIQAPQPIDLVSRFDELLAGSGIKEKQEELAKRERAFTEARGGIDDNPFLSEASRVGRQAKLQKLFTERTANIRGEIATSRADAETRLNLQLKQFDINSEQARQGLNQFNALLSAGALNNASGEDIAAITQSTGISSSMIRSAIEANQREAKNANTQVITSTDNAGNVTVSTINKNTGEVINQSSLGTIGGAKVGAKGPGPVKPGSPQARAENRSAVSTFLFSKTNKFGHVSPGDWQQAMQAWLIDGVGSRDDFINNFKNLTDPNRGDFETQSGYGFPLFVRNE